MVSITGVDDLIFARGSNLGLHAKKEGPGDITLGAMLKRLHRGPKEDCWACFFVVFSS